jgi:hypothetical protein
MSFYIQGTTKCALCCNLIEHYREVVRLPLLDDEIQISLISNLGNFIHRNCYYKWVMKDKFILANKINFENNIPELMRNDLVYSEYLFCVFYNKKKAIIEVHDLDLLFMLEFQVDINNNILKSVKERVLKKLTIQIGFYQIYWNSEGLLCFDKTVNGLLDDQIMMDIDQTNRWEKLLTNMFGVHL